MVRRVALPPCYRVFAMQNSQAFIPAIAKLRKQCKALRQEDCFLYLFTFSIDFYRGAEN